MNPNPSKPVIGIVGGIGAGKTAVTQAFDRLGCRVISADDINQQVLLRKDVIDKLVSWWGATILTREGAIDRRKVADIVFADQEQRRRLESLTHPLIELERVAIISRSIKDQAVKAIVLDSPLLLECNLDRHCHAVVFVDADEDVRLRRLARSRGWSAAELKRREQQQMPLDQKRARSRFFIDNNGPADALHSQVENVLNQVLAEVRHDSAN